MRTRLDMWEALAVAVASNPRVRTGKQAKMMIDFLMNEHEKVRAEIASQTPPRPPNPNAHEPMPNGKCSCELPRT